MAEKEERKSRKPKREQGMVLVTKGRWKNTTAHPSWGLTWQGLTKGGGWASPLELDQETALPGGQCSAPDNVLSTKGHFGSVPHLGLRRNIFQWTAAILRGDTESQGHSQAVTALH